MELNNGEERNRDLQLLPPLTNKEPEYHPNICIQKTKLVFTREEELCATRRPHSKIYIKLGGKKNG
ncbi:MAG: hypothetical protein MUF15_26600, partial [Acidobacteria bacterium]|nr:hypothetical protein [Acidobacteriota bacterium]